LDGSEPQPSLPASKRFEAPFLGREMLSYEALNLDSATSTYVLGRGCGARLRRVERTLNSIWEWAKRESNLACHVHSGDRVGGANQSLEGIGTNWEIDAARLGDTKREQ